MRRKLALLAILLSSVTARAGDSPIVIAERIGQTGGAKTEVFSVGFAHYSSRKDYVAENSRLIPLTPSQMKMILDVVKHQQICSLPAQITPEGPVLPDTPFFTIRVNLPGAKCEVTGSDLDQVKDRSVAGRFLAAWSAITGVVPEADR